MTETIHTVTVTDIETFADAFQWATEVHAIVRFYEADDADASKPSVRINVAPPDDTERYKALYYLQENDTMQDGFVAAAREVKAKYDEGEAAKPRRAMLRVV